MIFRITLFILIVAISSPIYGQTPTQPTITFKNTDQLLTIGKSITYLKDESATLTIADILKPTTQRLFVQYNRPIFAEPAQKGAYWFKFELENQTQTPLWLEVGSVYAWYVDFYRPDSTGQYTDVVKTGTFRSEASKEFPTYVFWLKLTGKSFQKTVYYLRIQTDTPLEVPLRIGSIQELSKHKTITDYITAGFTGIIIILLIFSIFIYNNLRERIYLYYAGYLLASVFVLPFLNNYPFVHYITLGGLLTPVHWWKYYLGWSSFLFLFITLFSVNFLQIRHHHPYFYKVIMFLFWATLLSSWSNFFGVTMAHISNPIQILTLSLYLSLFIAGILMSFKQNENAYFYISAWFFTLASAIIFVLALNGILPWNTFTRNAVYFGVTAEVIIFGFALGIRIKRLRNEKELAQAAIIQQIQENQRLIQEQNATLEQKVLVRTQDLENLNQLKDKLFSIISHDLRSPINNLKGYIGLLKSGEAEPEEFKNHMPMLEQQVSNIGSMLESLLNWSQSQFKNNQSKLVKEKVNLFELVEANRELNNIEIQRKSLTLENTLPQNTVVWADKDHVDTIVRNLLSNALKFTSPQGKVSFGIQDQDGSSLTFWIKDTGVGMTAEQLGKLFRTNTHFTTLGTEREQGIGLGLLICQEYIKANGGKIWVESQPKQGSTFFVKLPKAHTKVNALSSQ